MAFLNTRLPTELITHIYEYVYGSPSENKQALQWELQRHVVLSQLEWFVQSDYDLEPGELLEWIKFSQSPTHVEYLVRKRKRFGC